MQAGNPPDAPQLAPAVQRVKTRTGRPPRTVTADRGYGEASVDQALADLGVRNVVIPRKGRPGVNRQQVEHRRAFRRTVKWRTGREGRISTLKRGYGWDRSRLDSLEGAKTWTGHGNFTHNLIKIVGPHRLNQPRSKTNNAKPTIPRPESRDHLHQPFAGRKS